MKFQILFVTLLLSNHLFAQQNTSDTVRPSIAVNNLSIKGNSLELYTLSTGFIQIHSCHYQNCKRERSPYIFRFLKILKDTTRIDPIPINNYLIKHTEGNFLIDAGGDMDWNNLESWNCDPVSGNISRKIAQVEVRPDETILSRLNQINVAPSDINAAIITHLHFDHTAGLISLNTKAYVGKADLKKPYIIGSVPCKYLDGVSLMEVEPQLKKLKANPEDLAEKLLGPGLSLTSDGAIKVFSTPGHTPGSLSIRVRTDQGDLWFIGDIAFNNTEIEPTSSVAGIHTSIRKIRKLHATFKRIQRETNAILIPSHQSNIDQEIEKWLHK